MDGTITLPPGPGRPPVLQGAARGRTCRRGLHDCWVWDGRQFRCLPCRRDGDRQAARDRRTGTAALQALREGLQHRDWTRVTRWAAALLGEPAPLRSMAAAALTACWATAEPLRPEEQPWVDALRMATAVMEGELEARGDARQALRQLLGQPLVSDADLDALVS